VSQRESWLGFADELARLVERAERPDPEHGLKLDGPVAEQDVGTAVQMAFPDRVFSLASRGAGAFKPKEGSSARTNHSSASHDRAIPASPAKEAADGLAVISEAPSSNIWLA